MGHDESATSRLTFVQCETLVNEPAPAGGYFSSLVVRFVQERNGIGWHSRLERVRIAMRSLREDK